jgi:coiled-coil domain-containing protein 130
MQGFNMGRYYPPSTTSSPSFNTSKNPLGARASKLKTEGILTVRFELPFTIWCTTCVPETIIAQGVRFNAEKKQVGKYLSMPIWAFRFKHTVCGGWIEVRTDPKNTEYVVVEGGRRREYGGLKEGDLDLGLAKVSEEEKERLEKDGGMGMLEKKVEEKTKAEREKKRVEELWQLSGRDWGDPYERNRALRREFRVGRRQRQADEKSGEALKERFGMELEMVSLEEEDVQMARRVDFVKLRRAFNSPYAKPEGPSKILKQNKHIASLQTEVSRASRVAGDPFVETPWERPKRKRDEVEETEEAITASPVQVERGGASSLVDYDSDE